MTLAEEQRKTLAHVFQPNAAALLLPLVAAVDHTVAQLSPRQTYIDMYE